MSRIVRLALTTALILGLFTLLVGCSGSNSSVLLPAPYSGTAPSSAPSSPTPTTSTPNVSAGGSDYQPTPVPHWDQSIGAVPQVSTHYTVSLHAGQLFMLTGGRFQAGGFSCGGNSQQICVLLYRATHDETATASALITGQNWIGISSTFTPEGALQTQAPNFWQSPNCGTGCAVATAAFFTDGTLVSTQTLHNPGA